MARSGTPARRLANSAACCSPAESSPIPDARPARTPVVFAEVRPWRISRTVVMGRGYRGPASKRPRNGTGRVRNTAARRPDSPGSQPAPPPLETEGPNPHDLGPAAAELRSNQGSSSALAPIPCPPRPPEQKDRRVRA